MTNKDEVLKNLALGMTNKEIARGLFISHHTVKAYVAQLMRENNAKNRAELAYLCGLNDGRKIICDKLVAILEDK